MLASFSRRHEFKNPVSCFLLAALTIPLATLGEIPAQSSPSISAAQVLSVPMSFVKNSGQTDKRVDFITRGPGYGLFLTPTQAVFSLSATRASTAHQSRSKHPERRVIDQSVLQMNLLGANPRAVLEAIDQLPGTVNFFIGNHEANWQSNVPTFEKVKYHEVYQGISLIYYGNQRQLEYDFIVSPGANPDQISLNFPGIEKLEIMPEGDLLIHLA